MAVDMRQRVHTEMHGVVVASQWQETQSGEEGAFMQAKAFHWLTNSNTS